MRLSTDRIITIFIEHRSEPKEEIKVVADWQSAKVGSIAEVVEKKVAAADSGLSTG